jgi:hypothetical protein
VSQAFERLGVAQLGQPGSGLDVRVVDDIGAIGHADEGAADPFEARPCEPEPPVEVDRIDGRAAEAAEQAGVAFHRSREARRASIVAIVPAGELSTGHVDCQADAMSGVACSSGGTPPMCVIATRGRSNASSR